MKCSEVMELMQRYLDHDLAESEQQTMVSHLNKCPVCAAMSDRLQRISDELEQLPAVTPPYSIVDSILPRLEAILVTGGSPAPAVPIQAPKWFGRKAGRFAAWGTTAAAVALGILLVSDGTINVQHKMADKSASTKQEASVNQSGSSDSSSAAQKRMLMDSNQDVANPTPAGGEGAPASTAQTFNSKADENLANDQKDRISSSSAGSGTFNVPHSESTQKGVSPIVPVPSAGYGNEGKTAGGTSTDQKGSASSPGPILEPAKGDSDNVVTFNPGGILSSNTGMGSKVPGLGAASDPSRATSESGKYTAVVENQKVIVKNSEGSQVYASANQWKDSDSIRLQNWVNDSQLFYTVETTGGASQQYIIDLALQKELKK